MSVVYCPYCHECLGVGVEAEDAREGFHERCREMWQYDERLAEIMNNKTDSTFAPGKFVAKDSNEPVVGWVSVSAEVKRDYADQVQRAVIISDEDRVLLRHIRRVYPNATGMHHDEAKAAMALLDRLIGKR